MTQVGEAVAVGALVDDELKCPFDHKEPEPPKVDNQLIGSGTKLRDRMKAGRSTHTYADRYETTVGAVPNPKDDPKNRLHQSGSKRPEPVSIPIADDDDEVTYQNYPVTCAAHHCIPAQESLKRSALLDFMISKHEDDKLKNGDAEITQKGIVWSDIGYDVNGTENGVFLPGNYAVGGGRGGLRVWEEPDGDADNDEELDFLGEEPVRDGLPQSRQLTGSLYDISNQNRKWRYVKGAMEAAGGQFHDRHEAYSDHVLEALEKINTNLRLLQKKFVTDEKCKECKKKADSIEDTGIPSPYGLTDRLNGLSAKLRGHLTGASWPKNIYTSEWVKGYLGRLDGANKRRAKRRRK